MINRLKSLQAELGEPGLERHFDCSGDRLTVTTDATFLRSIIGGQNLMFSISALFKYDS